MLTGQGELIKAKVLNEQVAMVVTLPEQKKKKKKKKDVQPVRQKKIIIIVLIEQAEVIKETMVTESVKTVLS